MTALLHEHEVAARFDELQARFKDRVAADDVRLLAILDALGPIDGRRILDLGCGKGRFARRLVEEGAEVVGIDVSAAMLRDSIGIRTARATARRLPFAAATFDAVVAIEVFEHLPEIASALGEARRLLRPGGTLVIIDKNAASLNAQRPWLPSLLVKAIDERRGLWMYPSGGLVRERWFWPVGLRQTLRRHFERVRVAHLLSPNESRRWVFRNVPPARLFTLWTAHVQGRSA
jgi:2-polyprenyl-6-hydroxyphenyl methylase/3-demethylubiquinone-9 3-methyltransferase